MRFIVHASRDNNGSNNLHTDLQNLITEIKENNWDEAKNKFHKIIEESNFVVSDPTTKRIATMNLKKYGFRFLDFSRQEKMIEIQKMIYQLRKNSQEASQKGTELEKAFNNLKDNNWRIHNWKNFFEYNLPWQLKIDCYFKNILDWIDSKQKKST